MWVTPLQTTLLRIGYYYNNTTEPVAIGSSRALYDVAKGTLQTYSAINHTAHIELQLCRRSKRRKLG